MKQFYKLFILLSFVLTIQSCGVVTKARYGNGYKLNIENNWFGKKDVQNEEEKNQQKFNKKTEKAQTKLLPIRKFNTNAQKNYPNKPISLSAKANQKYEFKQPKLKSISQKIERKFNKKHTQNIAQKAERIPMETHSKWATILFVIGIIFTIALPMFGYTFLFFIVSFVLAIISLGKIKNSPYPLSGKTMDILIIVLVSLAILLSILTILLLVALFI